MEVTTVRMPDEMTNALEAEARAADAGADLGTLLPAILAAISPPEADSS